MVLTWGVLVLSPGFCSLTLFWVVYGAAFLLIVVGRQEPLAAGLGKVIFQGHSPANPIAWPPFFCSAAAQLLFFSFFPTVLEKVSTGLFPLYSSVLM